MTGGGPTLGHKVGIEAIQWAQRSNSFRLRVQVELARNTDVVLPSCGHTENCFWIKYRVTLLAGDDMAVVTAH